MSVESKWRLWYKHSEWSFDQKWCVQRKGIFFWKTVGKFTRVSEAEFLRDKLMNDEIRRNTKPEKPAKEEKPKKEGFFERMRKMQNENQTDR